MHSAPEEAANPHILNLAPPLDMEAKWFKNHVAYTMAKFGMSMCTLGMSAEFAKDGIAVNSLWPLTAIDTAAVRNLLGGESVAAMSRSPEILADAAHAIFNRPSRETTGNFFIDEEVLRAEGVSDFSIYAPGAKGPLAGDFFVPDEVFERTERRWRGCSAKSPESSEMPREVHSRMQYSTDDDVIIAQAEEDDVRADVVFQKAWSDAARISAPRAD